MMGSGGYFGPELKYAGYDLIIVEGRVSAVKGGPWPHIGEGPEYEATWAYGAQCGVDDVDAIIKANNLCDQLGIDSRARLLDLAGSSRYTGETGSR